MPSARPIHWDIYEEHLEEAAFLWSMWERAMAAANYALDDVIVGPEERLLAHLDGLVLGGKPVAEKLLLPALADDDPGKVTAAAWALLQSEHGDHLNDVMSTVVAAKEPKVLAPIARALELCHRTDLPERLLPIFEASALPAQMVIAGALASRQGAGSAPAGGLPLDGLLQSREPGLLIAGMRALRRARDPNLTRKFGPYVEQALSAEDAATRETAIETGVVLRIRAAWHACHRLVDGNVTGSSLPLALLALGSEPAEAPKVIGKLSVPEMKRDALWALGFCGTLEAAEAAMALIDDEKLGPLAGEALATITGVVLAGAMAKPGQTDRNLPTPEEDEAPPPELKPEDVLPVPDPERARAWWQKAKGAIKPGVRHLFGQPVSAESLRSALTISPTWRTRLLQLEIAARSPLDVDPRQWARMQKADSSSPPDLRVDRALASL